VWVVRGEGAPPPQTILATTDFSDASRRAVEQALWLAGQSAATLYVLHVIDEKDTPERAFEKLAAGTSRQSLRRRVRGQAGQRLQEFIDQLTPGETAGGVAVEPRLSWGTPWREIVRLARNLKTDLVAMGTVGRSGIQGLLLGNTAEKVLSMCETSILSVKPSGFVSPIAPPFWKLHPETVAATQGPPEPNSGSPGIALGDSEGTTNA
jgi:universal stress protein E